MRAALACHDTLLREAIESHNGHIFKKVMELTQVVAFALE